jgi:predicted Fe-Mo cluster-binding NifX family protein
VRVCVPTLDDRGHEGALSQHFGSAPYFTLVDSETGHLDVIANPNRHHKPGLCQAAEKLGTLGVKAIICVGLGRHAFAGLNDSGISVFVTDARSVREAVDGFRNKRLQQLTEVDACHGGRHRGLHH